MMILSCGRFSRLLPATFGLIGLAPTMAFAQALPDLSDDGSDRNGVVINSIEPITVPADYAASSYLLGPGDQVEVSVYGYEEYTGPLSVLPDGTITLPLVGKVPAAGRTIDQLARELTVVLDDILVNPYVSVTLNSLRPVVVNVSGEVYRPGPVQLQGAVRTNVTGASSSDGPPSVSSALVQAGGVTQTADIRDVVVVRALPNGETVRTKVNLWDALWSESLPEDMLLRDGDLVFVPELAEGDIINRRLLASSSLSPDTVRVRVVGEVTRPGEVPVPPNSSLSSAVAIAGGPTEDAKLSEVAFIRMNDAGEVEQEVVDLRDLVDTYQVQDGDVVVVPKTTTGSVLDFAQRLLGPLGFVLRI
ncbi:MAG: polysaccharide biosynthesis/export family protein, partial [Cyanobacteria bacterium P01_F01_bin.4]